MLMPSFCWPLGLGPNAWMTRPFTGQRNDGVAAVTSCLTLGGSGFCTAGVTTFTAVGGDAGTAATGAAATLCGAGAAAAGFGCAWASTGAAGLGAAGLG